MAAGLRLLNRDGLDAFSMRRLARELGVGTMTIYGHFRSKDELLDAIVDSGSQLIVTSIAAGLADDSWQDQLRRLMIAIRASLIVNPAIVELRYKRPILSPVALDLTEIGIRILRDAGFGKREAATLYRMLFIYTFGYSAFGPGPGSAIDRERALGALRGLSPDRYPALVGLTDEAAEAMGDEGLFELGLDAILDGLEERLSPG